MYDNGLQILTLCFFYIGSNETSTFVSKNYTLMSSSQWKKVSLGMVHFMKITNDEYLCKILKAVTPSKELKVKRDRSNITIKLWKHLEKFHIEIYKK